MNHPYSCLEQISIGIGSKGHIQIANGPKELKWLEKKKPSTMAEGALPFHPIGNLKGKFALVERGPADEKGYRAVRIPFDDLNLD